MRKLFYEDSHIRRFSATVTGCTPTEKGYYVTLDATAFYPEGGGQACDLGVLGEAKVLDVQEKGEEILHLCDRALPVGITVEGEIDWERRFDLMQQHTGEHILSGIIHSRYGYQNSGFHVGAQVMEVDFDGPISPEELQELELAANRAIWENRPVRCSIPAPEELPTITYRTKRTLPWPVRIVDVENYDSCACCGVHVKYTGEIGLIKLISCVKFHQGVRIEMVCGQRAYLYMQHIFTENRQISHILSAKMQETAVAVEKLQEAYNSEKYRAVALQTRVFNQLAKSYTGAACPLHFEEGLNGGALRELAEQIAAVCGAAIVCAGSEGDGYNICIIGKDAKDMGTQAAKVLNGRGGGKDCAFQGRFLASREQIEAYFVKQENCL